MIACVKNDLYAIIQRTITDFILLMFTYYIFPKKSKILNHNFYLQKMHSKLSMKNLQTFGQDNPFLRDRSLSSRHRQEPQQNPRPNINPVSPNSAHMGKSSYRQDYQSKMLHDVTNIAHSSQRTHSKCKQASTGQFNGQYLPSVPVHKFQQPSPIKGKIPTSYSCNQILYLLSNQQQCIQSIKSRIEGDKQKVNNSFQDFKQTISNIIDDLRLSVSANIDSRYQKFVNQFRILKLEYSHYCAVKREFWDLREGEIERTQREKIRVGMGSTAVRYPGMVVGEGRQSIDNEMLLLNMIQDIKDCKQHMNYVQFSEVQDKILRPLLHSAKDMIRQLKTQSYYDINSANSTFRVLQQLMENNMHRMYERMDLFVAGYEEGQATQARVIKDIFKDQQFVKAQHQQRGQKSKKKVSSPLLIQTQSQEAQYLVEVEQFRQKQKEHSTAHSQFKSSTKSKRPSNQSDHVQQLSHADKISFTGKAKAKKGRRNSSSVGTAISLQQIGPIVDKSNRTGKAPQTALCITQGGHNKMAVGTKSGAIKLFCTKTGSKLQEMHGHRASVCSLAYNSQQDLLVSGGDVGCCQLIAWQVGTGSIQHNFGNLHKAAITCIVDLDDGKHMVSGSFDCSLKVLSYRKKQMVKSVDTGQKITAMVKMPNKSGSDEQLLVTGNLNSEIGVWRIVKNSFNNVCNLELIRRIKIGTYAYCLAPLSANELMVAGKDNWLRTININQGSIKRAKQLGQFDQLVAVPNLNGLSPIFIGCNKNTNLCILDVEGDQLRQEVVGKSGCLSYSCGINPRSVAMVDGKQMCMYMPNHGAKDTQIKIWRVGHERDDYGLGEAASGTY